MANIWKKVERSIRYREHSTRKYEVPRRPERYYVIRLSVDGVMRQEALGWESEGITSPNFTQLSETLPEMIPATEL